MSRLKSFNSRANLLRWVSGHYGKANFYTMTHCDTGEQLSSCAFRSAF